MKHRSRHEKLKIYTILVITILYLPFTLFPMFLKDIPFFSSLVNNYIIAGRSFFISDLPCINILWFLPEECRITYFSIGHLIDIFIIINIVPCVETTIYHYIVKVCNEEETKELSYMDIYVNKSREKFNLLYFNLNYEIDIENDHSYESHNIYIKNYQNNKLRLKESNNDYNYQKINEYIHTKNQKRLFNKIFNSKLKTTFKLFNNSFNHSFSKNTLVFQKKNYNQYPKIKTISYKYSQWEGKT